MTDATDPRRDCPGPAAGRLVAVVGASGVGKDSLIDALAMARGLSRVRRTITRPPGAGESFRSVTPAAFARLERAGAFCLAWEAHGLSYGIPAATVALVAGGRDAVVNLSRGVLLGAQDLFPGLAVLHLTASPETLARRLGQRGREDAAAIAGRLGRAGAGLPDGLRGVATIPNDGPFEETLARAVDALYPESG